MDRIDFNKLGQVINTTWGSSSTTSGTYSLKFNLKSDKYLEVVYCTIVNMTTDHLQRDMRDKYRAEGDNVIDVAMKKLKEDYKEETDSTIKTKLVSENDSIEFVNYNMFNRKRTAYFRRNVMFEIS